MHATIIHKVNDDNENNNQAVVVVVAMIFSCTQMFA